MSLSKLIPDINNNNYSGDYAHLDDGTEDFLFDYDAKKAKLDESPESGTLVLGLRNPVPFNDGVHYLCITGNASTIWRILKDSVLPYLDDFADVVSMFSTCAAARIEGENYVPSHARCGYLDPNEPTPSIRRKYCTCPCASCRQDGGAGPRTPLTFTQVANPTRPSARPYSWIVWNVIHPALATDATSDNPAPVYPALTSRQASSDYCLMCLKYASTVNKVASHRHPYKTDLVPVEFMTAWPTAVQIPHNGLDSYEIDTEDKHGPKRISYLQTHGSIMEMLSHQDPLNGSNTVVCIPGSYCVKCVGAARADIALLQQKCPLCQEPYNSHLPPAASGRFHDMGQPQIHILTCPKRSCPVCQEKFPAQTPGQIICMCRHLNINSVGRKAVEMLSARDAQWMCCVGTCVNPLDPEDKANVIHDRAGGCRYHLSQAFHIMRGIPKPHILVVRGNPRLIGKLLAGRSGKNPFKDFYSADYTCMRLLRDMSFLKGFQECKSLGMLYYTHHEHHKGEWFARELY